MCDRRPVHLEYFSDPQSLERPVLLIYGDNADGPALLRDALTPLIKGQIDHVQIDRLAGFQMTGGCSLTAEIGTSSLGVVPMEGGQRGFRCILEPAGWDHVVGLLEPFVTGGNMGGRHAHQYLTETGPIEWIISTDRSW